MTIKDLAAKTGYAVGTVSRVLNNHPSVSEKARTAILAAVEESGFRLNANARQLKQLHGTTILVIVKGNGNVLFFQMVEKIQALLSGTRYSLHVEYIHAADNEVRRAAMLSREKKALGVIFLGGRQDHFRSDFAGLGLPGVLVTNDGSGLGFENLSSVCVDDRKGARQAVEALLALGHRKVAVIGGDWSSSDVSLQRWQGAQDAMHARDLTMDMDGNYVAVPFTPEGGYEGVAELLRRGREFTAIFAMSDLMAIGAIRALQDYGIRVPGEVSVVGFDGVPLCEFTVPRLTSVGQPALDMAERSVQLLLDTIENSAAAHHEIVHHTILYRESTAPVRE